MSPAALVVFAALCAALVGAAPAVAAPPVPSFTTDPAEVQLGGPVTFTSTSTDPDGDALTASWDFNGDGTADATGTTVSFTFPSAGTPTVVLNVADAAGESASTSRAIAVLAPQATLPPEPPAPPPPPTNVPPTASFTVAPGAPTVGQTVTFASTSTDSDGTIASQRWDLDGDGQFDDAAGATVTWAYSGFGTRNVRLRVRDNAGANATATRAVTVNQPPSASFTAAPSVVVAGDSVTFASTSRDADGSIRGLEWSLDGDEGFDDGTTSTVTRTYATPGVVVVRLRVTDNLGATAVVTGLVTVVADQPPLASFTFAPTFPEAAAPVVFTSASSDPDGTLTALSWDLDGDGFFDDATGASAAWTYRINGSFMVALRATDNRGASSIAFQTVVVRGTVSLHKGETSSPAGTSAAGTNPPGSSPRPGQQVASATGQLMMSPFPIVRIRGQAIGARVRVDLVSIRAPRGAKVLVRCRGTSCPRGRATARAVSAARPVRVKVLEHRYAPGAVLEVYVTLRGRIGKYVRFTIRNGKAPSRRDGCLAPSGTRLIRCPGQ